MIACSDIHSKSVNSSERERGREHVRIVKEHQNILGEDNGDRQTDKERRGRERNVLWKTKEKYILLFLFLLLF